MFAAQYGADMTATNGKRKAEFGDEVVLQASPGILTFALQDVRTSTDFCTLLEQSLCAALVCTKTVTAMHCLTFA